MQMQFSFGQRIEDRELRGSLGAAKFRVQSARQLRPARVDPRRHPVGADIGRGIGELADQHGARLRVEAVVVFVVVARSASFVRAAVRQKNIFEPGMRAQSHFKRMVGGIGR